MAALIIGPETWMACLFSILLLTLMTDTECMKFRKMVINNGDMVGGVTLRFGAASGGIECASECMDGEGCTHFAYNSDKQQCFLYGGGAGGNTSTIEAFEICGPNKYRIGGRCIVFERGPVTWHQARDACAHMDGRLAVIDSQMTFDALRDIVFEKNQESWFSDVWVDGNEENMNGNWVIWNGSSLSWTSWATRQPDNYLGNEDCMGFRTDMDFFLNDGECTWESPYICELNLEP